MDSDILRRRGRAETQLGEALESITEGVVLFGPDDRLVLSNAKYREIYPLLSDILVPGISFEDILRAAAARGRFEDAEGRVEEWVAERVLRHRTQGEAVERLLGDGRWYRISQRTTGSGGIVQIFTDVTELIGREAALVESQRRFRDFAETGADWLWEIDNERRIAYFSGTLAGRDSESMIGCDWRELLVESANDTKITAIIERLPRLQRGLSRHRIQDGHGQAPAGCQAGARSQEPRCSTSTGGWSRAAAPPPTSASAVAPSRPCG